MAKNLDLTLLPLYRLRGNELPSLPGLMALTPPRRPARSRDKDHLVVHLTLAGNAPFSTVNYLQLTSAAAEEFYKTPGTVTSALRSAAMALNGDLLEYNLELSGQGHYAVGNLILCALRGNQLYILESGAAHIYWMADHERAHIHEPALAGRGLGMGQATNAYLTQMTVRTGGRLLLTPKFPPGWEQILQRDNYSAPLEILRNALMRQNTEDENAVLVEVSEGRGVVNVLKPKRRPPATLEIITQKIEAEPRLPDLPPLKEKSTPESHQPQPLPTENTNEENTPASTPRKSSPLLRRPPRENRDPAKDWTARVPDYIEEVLAADETVQKPPQAQRQFKESKPKQARTDILASIPKKEAVAPTPSKELEEKEAPAAKDPVAEADVEKPSPPSTGEVVARKSALALAKSIQTTRQGNEKLKDSFEKILPRLLPKEDEEAPAQLPKWTMALIAVLIPLIVVTIASLVYIRLGSDVRYETYYTQAMEARSRAILQDDPVASRLAWQEVLTAVNLAEERKKTDDTRQLRAEAEAEIDVLLGVLRLGFTPAVNSLPHNIKISRIAANDSEIFMLDQTSGKVLRAYLSGSGYQYDESFLCEPGNYGGRLIEKLVEIQILPRSNAFGASVLAFDAQGGLLYCAANMTPQATHLLPPAVGFRDVTSVALQADVLYVLDAPSREVWVYGGRASSFVNYPTAFFSTETPGNLEFASDLSIHDTDLYLLFNDGHLASCRYSLLDSVPTRCTDPVALVDPNPAAGGGNTFREVAFKQIVISEPPDAAILLLDGRNQSVYRFSPRSYELLNKLQPRSDGDYALPAISLNAVTANANHVLFIAQDDQVFMTMDAP